MITAQNRVAAANIVSSNLKSGTDFSIAAIMARDELSRESSEYSISKEFYIIISAQYLLKRLKIDSYDRKGNIKIRSARSSAMNSEMCLCMRLEQQFAVVLQKH